MLYNTLSLSLSLSLYIYIYIYIYIYPVHPEIIHRNNPKHEIFRFDIQSEMATETEFKTLGRCGGLVLETPSFGRKKGCEGQIKLEISL